MFWQAKSADNFVSDVADNLKNGLPKLEQADIIATVLKMQFWKQLQIEKLHPNEGLRVKKDE